MSPQRNWSAKPLNYALALLVAVMAVAFSAVGLFNPVEDALTSSRANILDRQATGQVAIVEIDAKSLAELRSWPWPREYHAKIVRRLHGAGASIIAFDVDFSARSPSGDEEFAAAIKDAGHVVLPIFEQTSSGRNEDGRLIASRPDNAFSDAWVGGVNIFPDRDGVVREYPAATIIEGSIQPSIATLVAETHSMGDRSFQPDWAIDKASIPRLSFADVIAGRFSARDVRGKRMIIGATAIELGDRYAVPRYGVVPGVVVQALAAESLLQGRAMQRTGTAVTIMGVLLIALLMAPRPIHRPARYVALCTTILTIIVTAPILVQARWPVAVDSAAWLFASFAAIAVQIAVEARRRLKLRAQIDAESGLPNRSMLELALAGAGDSVLVTAAIERFETIRDGVGLAASNEMIRNAAAKIESMVDAPVYRIAPDQIAWLQPVEGETNVRSIQAAFREPVKTQAGPIDVTFTFGLDRPDGTDAVVLRIERALSAVTSARSVGKSVEWYRGADPQVRRQLSMMSDLRHAMDMGRLRLAYQPKMLLSTNLIGDAEALIRWYDADGKTVSPDEFIPLAEATGVIREVTIFALRSATAEMKHWAMEGVRMRVAVNVSALDLAKEDFAGEIDAILAESGVPASQLALEVTESALIRSPAEAIAALNALREMGIRLSVDDYGTGQSTLSYLKHLPVHELKIDKSFVTTLPTSDSDRIMVRSTIDLAHELGLQVVAEGIEDQATLDILRSLGCDYAQGYFISKPIGAKEFLELVSDTGPRRLIA